MDDDSLIGGRARRPKAGNRMRELLEQSVDPDEVFAEVEDDVDFETRDDEQDIVDSDFDDDSQDEASGEDDEAEAQAVTEERRERRKPRAVPRVPHVDAGAPARAPAPRPRRPIAVSFEGGRRSSSRHATVQSKLEVQSKLQQAEERRAAQPVRKPKRRKAMTQDALIAEALETEEDNTQSLQHLSLIHI